MTSDDLAIKPQVKRVSCFVLMNERGCVPSCSLDRALTCERIPSARASAHSQPFCLCLRCTKYPVVSERAGIGGRNWPPEAPGSPKSTEGGGRSRGKRRPVPSSPPKSTEDGGRSCRKHTLGHTLYGARTNYRDVGIPLGRGLYAGGPPVGRDRRPVSQTGFLPGTLRRGATRCELPSVPRPGRPEAEPPTRAYFVRSAYKLRSGGWVLSRMHRVELLKAHVQRPWCWVQR